MGAPSRACVQSDEDGRWTTAGRKLLRGNCAWRRTRAATKEKKKAQGRRAEREADAGGVWRRDEATWIYDAVTPGDTRFNFLSTAPDGRLMARSSSSFPGLPQRSKTEAQKGLRRTDKTGRRRRTLGKPQNNTSHSGDNKRSDRGPLWTERAAVGLYLGRD